MPGYRELPLRFVGRVADATRVAQERDAVGDANAAIFLYEAAVALTLADGDGVPGFLCGRLAVLYRKAGRLEDEILLLERYAMSQVSETLLNRFVSRLGKVRALSDRVVRRDSGALASVRLIAPARRASSKAEGARARALLHRAIPSDAHG